MLQTLRNIAINWEEYHINLDALVSESTDKLNSKAIVKTSQNDFVLRGQKGALNRLQFLMNHEK